MGYVYFTDDQKQRANAVNLEDFLTRQGEKLLRSGREKRLASDHSITVRGNEWYDHAAEKGGCAIDFVQRFYGRSFPDAVTMLLNGEQGQAYRSSEQRKPELPRPFVLPEANHDMRRVYAYLTKTRCLGTGADRQTAPDGERTGYGSCKPDTGEQTSLCQGTDREGVEPGGPRI